MSTEPPNRELEIIESVADKGPLAKARAYTKLSGPGWLQGAITLGGGSLAGALYLGVISGFNLMWLQPLAMVCGIIMLSAIAYVTLSTRERPFGLINRHLSPLLGWSWLIATIMANIVWCMPQFNLGRAAVQQNLIPAVGEGTASTVVICLVLLVVAFLVNVAYESEGKGLKAFEIILKTMVGIIVISFFLVVIALSVNGAVPWGRIFAGIVPNPSHLFNPAPAYAELIAQSSNPDWWNGKIASDQLDIIITAFGTAVGINMTFLLPYSMLRKKWGGKHRGLAIFDLSIGLFVPFFLATGCVVIASASQFHAQTDDIWGAEARAATAKLPAAMQKTIDSLGSEEPNDADKMLAAMLVKRDNFQLATALQPLAGKAVSQTIFGIGVFGMALSTIIILMLINGFAFQELLGQPGNKAIYLMGCMIAGFAGAAGPFIWGNAEAKAALAVPTSVIGGSLIPIAYFTFLLLMNSRSTLGDKLPKGGKRVLWNVLMIGATGIASFGSVWVLMNKTEAAGFPGLAAKLGLGFLALLFLVGLLTFLAKERRLGSR
ncbi:MAG: hypothetical protein HKN82_05970 [Akkermansiaceae bacterium]|nr:hypothetical protein [Akkermansiaceae bacterium]NNM28683.1 hypothetical protein [Akkermansiaceae bacterium]